MLYFGLKGVIRPMEVSYKKLWKLLIDRDMKKQDLCKKAGVSTSSLAKLGRGENVNTAILVKICRALDCNVEDIMEIVPDTKPKA
jgi:putative transcriptional regulator